MQRLLFYAFRSLVILPVAIVTLFLSREQEAHALLASILPSLCTFVSSQQWAIQNQQLILISLRIEMIGIAGALILMCLCVNMDITNELFYPFIDRIKHIQWQGLLRRFLLCSPVIYAITCLCANIAYYTGHMPVSSVFYNIQDDFKYFVIVCGIAYFVTRSKKGM